MIKSFLTKLLFQVEGKLSNRIKENIFRNVFLYPSVLLMLLLPILISKHPLYISVLAFLAFISLLGYFVCLKRRVICQVEYQLMLFLVILATFFSYIGFFIHDEVYNYMFIFSFCVGAFPAMNILMMFTGQTRKILKHYIDKKFLDGFTADDLLILEQFLQEEKIIVRFVFSNFKELYKCYLDKADLYIGIDVFALDNCRISDNLELSKNYSLLDFIQHMREENLTVNILSNDDFKVFEMKNYE